MLIMEGFPWHETGHLTILIGKTWAPWIRPALTVAAEFGAGDLLMGSTYWTEHYKTWTHSHTAPRVTCHVSRVTAAHLAGPQPHARDSAAAVTRLTLVTRQLLLRTHRRHSPSPPRRTACCPWWPLGWGGGSPGSPGSPGCPGRSPRPDWAQDGCHCSVFTVASAAPGLLCPLSTTGVGTADTGTNICSSMSRWYLLQ